MDWLIKLLAVEVPDDTVLQSAELSFRGNVWLVVPLIVLLGAGAFVLYWKERGKLGRLRRAGMALLRTAVLAILLFLLFRPILLAEFQGQRSLGVVLLLDNSQSLQQQDRRLGDADKLRVAIANNLVPLQTSITASKIPFNTPKDPKRADLVRAALQHPELKLLDRLRQLGPLRPFLFGPRLHLEETGAEQLLAAFKADEARTALADAIHDLLQRKDGDLPAAIVAITDGQDNASKFTLEESARACAQVNVPLFIWGVGSTESGSLQLREVAVPDTIFFDDLVNVPIRWRSQGFKKGTVEIELKLGGKLVAHRELPLQNGEDLRETLSFIHKKEKDKEQNLDLVASIRLKDNDLFKDALTRPVRIIDSKIKVLFIEGSPRFEYKFLQPALLRDRRVDVSFFLVNADPKVLQSGPPFLPEFPPTREKFFEARYDLLILGDVPASALPRDKQEWIADFVKDRGGLIVIAGRQHMPVGYDQMPLGELLPIEFAPTKFKVEADLRTQEYLPLLTEVGKRTDWLALADTPEENLKIWEALPGFHWLFPPTKLRPGATALVVNPRAKLAEEPMPVLASQFFGQGQVLFMGTDETWRWRFNAQDKHFGRFWGQVIYQLGLPHMLGQAARRVQVALERSEAILDRPGSVFVRLLDKDFQPRKEKQVEAVLEYLDARPGQEKLRKIVLQAIPGRDGEYRALLAHDRPGRFEIKIDNPEPTSFPFRVDLPPRHELAESGLAESALREMARQSGGKFYREEDLHRLVEELPARKASFTRRQEVILWNPLAMLLFVGLITAEWLVRKFANLS